MGESGPRVYMVRAYINHVSLRSSFHFSILERPSWGKGFVPSKLKLRMPLC